MKCVFPIQSFDWYWGCFLTNLQFLKNIFFNKGALAAVIVLAAVISHRKNFRFSPLNAMLHCHWNKTYADHTSLLVNESSAEIFYFCASVWQLSFFFFPIIIFPWCIILFFILLAMKRSGMIVLTFFTYNYLHACLCWMITWNRITTPKTEFIFDVVPASLVHTEF